MRRALFLMPSDRMGGAERVVRTVAKEAARSGHFDHVDIFVLCWGRTGTLDELENMGNVALRYAHATHHALGLWRMASFVKARHYELVFSSATHINAFASLLRRTGWLNTERLVARESTVILDRQFGPVGPAIKALYRLYGAQDLIVCQTDRMRESLARYTGGRLRHLLEIIPNPIDFDRVEEGKAQPVPTSIETIPEDRTKIVWCGRLSPVKCPRRAVDVLKALHDAGRRDMHLVMIGDGPEREAIAARIGASGLIGHVTLAGHCPSPSGIMARCDYGLLTSDTEGFPNVILEMFASGVQRVVTTDCAGGLAEIPGVCVVPLNNAAMLASALLMDYRRLADVHGYLALRRCRSFLCRVIDSKEAELQPTA